MKYTQIILTKKDKYTLRKQVDKTLVTDFLSVTRFSDPNQSFKIYQEKRKQGRDNVSWVRGVLTEEYPEMKKDAIIKMTIEQLELLKEKMKDKITIKWEIKE